jgi:hypothetical protein
MNTRRRERGQAASLLLCFLLSLGMLLGPAHTAQAQEGTTGIVAGELTDASGGVLPGVSVVFTNSVNGRVHTVQTDGSGAYRIELPPGAYAVRFELSGFARQETPRLEVQLGRTYDLDASLKVGNISEAVQVTAENAPLVDTRGTMIAHNVTAEEIDRLPKGRSFQSIALAAPSVNSGEIEGGFQVNGASGAENAFTVDGVNTTSLVNGASRQNTVFEYIQEVQVKTTGIPAEFGGALGGVISAVTKSGGNIFTGETHYYHDGSTLSAGPVKRLVLSPIDDKTVTYVQDEKQADIRHEFGGSLGGPIVRDRVFFFGSFSPRINTRTNDYLFSSGTDPGEIKRTSKFVQGFGKISVGSRRVNAYGTVLATPSYVKGTLLSYNGIGPQFTSSSKAAAEPNVERGWEQMQVNVTGNVDVVITNGAYATFRVGNFHDRYSDTGIPNTTSWTYQTLAPSTLSNGATLPASLQGPVSTVNTPRALITNFDTTKRRTFNADYNHTFQGAGWHTLKGGLGFQKVTNDVNSLYPGGYVFIWWDSSTNFTGQTRDRGTYGYYEVNNSGTIGQAGSNITSLYVQDQWQIGDRLTLNLGIRTENESIPTFRPDIRPEAFAFSFADKIAPRLGFAYDVMGNGRAKLYASYGRYYDWTKYELARGSFGGDIWCVKYRAIDDPNAPLTANYDNAPGRDLWRPGGATTASGCRDRRGHSIDAIDPNLKPMSQDSFSAGFDFEVNERTVATVHFVHNNLVRTIEDLAGIVDGDEVYVIGNPGEGFTEMTLASSSPLTAGGTLTSPGSFATPKPMRQYDAVEFGISRRFSGRWFGSANLTISRLYGNYAGIASSDEIRTPTTGVSSSTAQQQGGSTFRQGGNANRAWDLDDWMFDAQGNLDVRGRLATDRPVVAKFYGAYNLATNTQIGAFVYAGSGTPITTYVATNHQTEVMPFGRGDMGRTPFFSKTDLLLSHELLMAGNKRMRFELNVLNAFNQKTARHIFNYLNRGAGTPRSASAINLGNTALDKGYDVNALIRATPDGENAYDPRYGMDDLFEPGTQGQVSVKFLF